MLLTPFCPPGQLDVNFFLGLFNKSDVQAAGTIKAATGALTVGCPTCGPDLYWSTLLATEALNPTVERSKAVQSANWGVAFDVP